jgi:DNA-binding NtrC family response regulator
MRVLILDEDRFWREMAQDCLRREGYRVDTVHDAVRLRQALTKCPDVILLGFPAIRPHEEELIADVCRTCPRAVALVFSTSWPVTQAVERRLLRHGVVDVMGRPSFSCDLVDLVESEYANQDKELASLSSYARFRLQEAK